MSSQIEHEVNVPCRGWVSNEKKKVINIIHDVAQSRKRPPGRLLLPSVSSLLCFSIQVVNIWLCFVLKKVEFAEASRMVEFAWFGAHRFGVELLVIEDMGVRDDPRDERIGLNLVGF